MKVACMLEQETYKPGDLPPEGYLARMGRGAHVTPNTELERLVMHKNSEELIDKLALMLGIAGDESAEARWSDEVFKRKVLRGAIIALDAEWNPKCCEGGQQWGHAWGCKELP